MPKKVRNTKGRPYHQIGLLSDPMSYAIIVYGAVFPTNQNYVVVMSLFKINQYIIATVINLIQTKNIIT